MATNRSARTASNLLRGRVHYRIFTPNFILRVCRNCSSTTTEMKNDDASANTAPKMQEDEERARRRDEGKKLHAMYHIEVDKIAAKFLLKRREEEMNLSQELLKKRELRKLEEEMHDRIILSVHLENERVKQLREKRLENEKLRYEEYKKEKEHLRRELEAEQRQERVELVKRLIEERKNWVTEENLDEKIVFCLENETNYNFALTPSGEKIYSTVPPGCIDTKENAPGPAAYYPKGLPSIPERQELDVR